MLSQQDQDMMDEWRLNLPLVLAGYDPHANIPVFLEPCRVVGYRNGRMPEWEGGQ